MSTKTLLTGEDLLRLGDIGRCELVKGELIPLSPAGGIHGRHTARIVQLLQDFVDEHDLGSVYGAETGFYLSRDPDTVRGVDAMFYSRERLDPAEEIEGFLPFAPDLAVEVVSPSDKWTEVEEKVDQYLSVGVRLVWVINPRRRTVSIYPGGKVLHETDVLTGGEVLPGFSCPVARLFGLK